MKIDIEQFLAMTVALGCAGAVTFAVYSDRSDMSEVIAGIEAAEEPVSYTHLTLPTIYSV